MPQTFFSENDELLIDEFRLPISKENSFLLPIIAEEFGYIPGSEMNPKEVIVNYLKGRREETRARVLKSLQSNFGKDRQNIIDGVMQLYDSKGVLNIEFKKDEEEVI